MQSCLLQREAACYGIKPFNQYQKPVLMCVAGHFPGHDSVVSRHEPGEANVREAAAAAAALCDCCGRGMANVLKAGGARVVTIDPAQRLLSVSTPPLAAAPLFRHIICHASQIVPITHLFCDPPSKVALVTRLADIDA